MFGGNHNHSHDGGTHGHSHSGSHGHSHGQRSAMEVGFGDEEDHTVKSNMPNPNMMMMQMMMANAMKMAQSNANSNDPTNGDVSKSSNSNNNNNMMMDLPQMSPQMMELAKKMFEQRQQLMKEYMDKDPKSNPAVLQEMMSKAAQAQAAAIAEFKALSQQNQQQQQQSNQTNRNDSNNDVNIPQEIPIPGGSSGMLSANLNTSKLDELINKNGSARKKAKEAEEAFILDAIARKDFSQLNAVKATQYGVLERLKELVDSGQCDPNKSDSENVYLLHWAAINNRLDIAQYLLSVGCYVDPVGGELESTPLNWAARSGHIQMVMYLIQNGANQYLFDLEGYSTIHLATMFGHSIVVAYLLAKGMDADMPDKNGASPLMFAAQRIHNRDPAQLLITFNARLNAQDSKGNTPLHYCVAYNNATVMKILLEKGASLDIKNLKGLSPVEFALDRKKMNAVAIMNSYKDDKENLPPILRTLSKNKDVRKNLTRSYPFFLLFYVGFVLEQDISWTSKALIIGFFYAISYGYNILFFDRLVFKYIPVATAMAFITWSYVTWLLYFMPFMGNFSLYTLSFALATVLSWYNFYKAWKTDPGVLISNRDQMNKTILQFVEQSEFTLDTFCTACIVRKPLRSKHCIDCNRCVAKFDHHCPWVDNCIGQFNYKYFVGFLFWTPICLIFYLHGAITYYQQTCYQTDLGTYTDQISSFRLFIQFLSCSSWVGFFTIIACLNTFWISCLCVCHIYQSVFIALTTNERLNLERYKHFFDKNGKYHNPFNFGFMQNFVDLIDTKCCFLKPTLINWKKEHDIQDLLASRFDKKKEKPNYQEV